MGQAQEDKKTQNMAETPGEDITLFEECERDIDLTYLYALKQAILTTVKKKYIEKQNNKNAPVNFPSHDYINRTALDGAEYNLNATGMLENRLASNENHFRGLHLPLQVDETTIVAMRKLIIRQVKPSFLRMKRAAIEKSGIQWRDEQVDHYLAFCEAQINLFTSLHQSIAYLHASLHDDPEFKEILVSLDAVFLNYLKLSACFTQPIEELKINFSTQLFNIFEQIDLFHLETTAVNRLNKEGSLNFLREVLADMKADSTLFKAKILEVPREPDKTLQFNFHPEEPMGQFEKKVKAALAKAIYPELTTLTPETTQKAEFHKVGKRVIGGFSAIIFLAVTALIIAIVLSNPVLWIAFGVAAALVVGVGVGVFIHHRQQSEKNQQMTQQNNTKTCTTDAYLLQAMKQTPGLNSISAMCSKQSDGVNNDNKNGGDCHERTQNKNAEEARETQQASPANIEQRSVAYVS